jgi:hypothetical protein
VKRKMITVASLILFIAVGSHAKEWHGIVPLHSTRADVARILGSPSDVCKCSYHSENVNVFIVYSSGSCKNGGSGDWNIAPDTVIRFSVYPGIHPRLSTLGLSESKFKIEEDPELPGIFHYFDKEEGFGLTVEDGLVRDFFYEPAAKDKRLRCAGARA